MNLKQGTLIKSTGLLSGTVFDGVQILIVAYNQEGAVGFIINKPFGRSLHQLAEFQLLPFFPLYHGGPVDEEHLFFIHQRPDLIEQGTAIEQGLYWSGDFNQVIAGIQNGQLTTQDVQIFVGYCGWDAGELEVELEEGSWTIATEKPAIFL